MDVKNVSSNIVVNNYLKNTLGVKKVEEVQKTSKTDKIELSKFAKEMASISNMSDETIRNKKIDEIKNALENGTYKIKPEEIAKKMIEDMRG
ncbi:MULTISPECIES: flagellar biosynthesis anti-sigma factor FlgM [unclassified Clostridioides]|uniref:flagellar biosynthesis anti-sigma factor FlgM n=1 Tax=unclassified Clostridioides TaxID=2635829 RepID=UPI001D0F706B|nr:flagellar biosynthesis anti-sigma factor FlgM [Clostridioides sp. ZZV15-6598]MCC0729901.1 flagellar biosynthesis anti-sigma factor FlgM [Clostridioides sp. ZZV14-6048]MCC0734783.1 flagellar biosynthesis anti-sigma factor FlgM [Clostridioides sp. ZZV14-6009]